MSNTAQGPGWWQASDGMWYPPESRQSPVPVAAAPASAGSTQPASGTPSPQTPGAPGQKKSKKQKILGSPRHPGVWDDYGTGHGLDGFASTNIGPPEMDKKRYALSRPLTLVIVIVLIGAATFGVVKLAGYIKNGGDPPNHSSPSAVAKSFTQAFLQNNGNTASADLPPGVTQTFESNVQGDFSNASFDVTNVTMTSETTAQVTITACPEVGTPCSPQLSGAITGVIPVINVNHNWYVDLKFIQTCGTGPFNQTFDCH